MQPETNQPVNQQSTNNPQPPKKSNKKPVLITLLVILLLAAVGAGAWWYGSSQAEKKADEQITDLQSQIDDLKQQQAAQKSEDKDSIKQDDTSKYLTVKEWGVKFDISDAPQGIRYKIKQTPGDTYESGSQTLYWYASEKDSLGAYCANEDAYTVVIVKSNKPTVTMMDRPVNGKRVGSSYYYIDSSLSGGPCSDNVEPGAVANNPMAAKERKIHQQFIAVSNSIQAQ